MYRMASTLPRTLACVPVSTQASEWDASIAYAVGNLVRYTTVSGTISTANYVCIVGFVSNKIPKAGNVVNTAYWSVVKDGEPWWDATTTYYPGDVVSYSTNSAEPVLYQALIVSVDEAPSYSGTVYWKQITSIPVVQVVCGTNALVWSAIDVYLAGDIVQYDSGILNICCVARITVPAGGPPPQNNTNWKLLSFSSTGVSNIWKTRITGLRNTMSYTWSVNGIGSPGSTGVNPLAVSIPLFEISVGITVQSSILVSCDEDDVLSVNWLNGSTAIAPLKCSVVTVKLEALV